MSKKILIDTSSDKEIRIAVTQNGKLDEFEIEREKNQAVKGDVYLAKISRVEPSLQAAFVDYGVNRHGFLPFTEIHPDYFKIPTSDKETLKKLSDNLHSDEDIDEVISAEDKNKLSNNNLEDNNRKNYLNFFKKYKIQEVIKQRQVILVQINKEERVLKGAALTTFLSFAGRYCVLMPNSLNNDGISRKIADFEERKKLRSILASINMPEKMSVIIRTAGIGKTKKEISKDLEFLTTQWNKIREKTLKSDAPTFIYEEGNIIKRTIRDLLNNDIDEVLIDGKNGYDIAKKYAKNLIPLKAKYIKLFNNKDKTLFNDNNIEHQINDLFSLKVTLQSGGSIVINATEALVAIDVNSGRNTSERDIENTALKTNLEAANEIARQLRLRDLGGLIVVDFIDMYDYKNNFKVEQAMKKGLYKDRARVQLGRISTFGLLELSRQRLRSSLIEKSYEKCSFCNGSGITLNIYSISEQIIKVIKEKLIISEGLKVKVKCNSALAETFINIKRKELNSLEDNYNANIKFSFDDYCSLNEPKIELDENNKKSKTNNKKVTKIIKSIKITKRTEDKSKKKLVKKQIKKKKKFIKKSSKAGKKIVEIDKNIIAEENDERSENQIGD